MKLTIQQLQELFDSASQAAQGGDDSEAVRQYQVALTSVQNSRTQLPAESRAQIIRSVAFNLAQSLNKLGRFAEALEHIELGMEHHPTAVGMAIALAARGEALCGLQRLEDGQRAFEEAAQAHPIIGRLNSAEAMVRLGMPALVFIAEQWVNRVVSTCGSQLNDSLRAEVHRIREQISHHKNAVQPIVSDNAIELIEKARLLAKTPGKLTEAADLMEQALTQSPDLRERYESILRLWRKGIAM